MPEGRFTGEYEIIPPVKKAEPSKLTMTGTDTRPDNKYNPDQLRMGIKVELEHTDDSAVAERIAKDHLDEMPDYYSRLRKMESGKKK